MPVYKHFSLQGKLGKNNIWYKNIWIFWFCFDQSCSPTWGWVLWWSIPLKAKHTKCTRSGRRNNHHPVITAGLQPLSARAGTPLNSVWLQLLSSHCKPVIKRLWWYLQLHRYRSPLRKSSIMLSMCMCSTQAACVNWHWLGINHKQPPFTLLHHVGWDRYQSCRSGLECYRAAYAPCGVVGSEGHLKFERASAPCCYML